jgi:hypothetical protein
MVLRPYHSHPPFCQNLQNLHSWQNAKVWVIVNRNHLTQQQNLTIHSVLIMTTATQDCIRYALQTNQVVAADAMKSYHCTVWLMRALLVYFYYLQEWKVCTRTHSCSSKMASSKSGGATCSTLWYQHHTRHSCFLLFPLSIVSGAEVLLGASSLRICIHGMSSWRQLVLWTYILHLSSKYHISSSLSR